MASTNASHCAEAEGYDNAVAALLSPLHQSITPETIRAAAARRRNTLHDMHVYLHRLGLNLNDDANAEKGRGVYLPPLIFHVTGTKGKGSTLSLCESILRNAHGLNTGMFTSPHLVSIRERIRINGVPVSREVFGRVYWTVRKKLEQNQSENAQSAAGIGSTGDGTLPQLPVLPGYFRMLTLMGLYTFCHYQHLKIDAILLEVGMGGRYDATNVFEPLACPSSKRVLVRAVTLIDYDHTRVLGSQLTQIAWEKGGIFLREKNKNISMDDGGYDKFLAGCAISRDQKRQKSDEHGVDQSKMVFASGTNKPEVLGVLQDISNNNNYPLQIVHNLSLESFPHIGLQGDHQRSNASLAYAMCQYAAEKIRLSSTASREKIQNALSRTLWPGRCHTINLSRGLGDSSAERHGNKLSMNLRCDGAHTPISINACIGWFRQVSTTTSSADKKVQRVLIFNCSHERNPLPLLYSIYNSRLFDSVYFCRADFERPSVLPKRLEDEWVNEPLSSAGDNGGVVVSLESMCVELGIINLPDTTDGVPCLDPLKMSMPSWQGTLSNVWNVYDMYSRYCISESSSRQPSLKATAGLRVNEAILDIQKIEALHATNLNGDGGTNNVGKKQVLVEVCVTGSLYMVGSALKAAGWEEGAAPGTIC